METSKVVLGVLGGIAAGAVLGVLFAPKKGSKTRRDILNKGVDYADDLKEKLDDLLGTVSKKYEGFLHETKELISNKEETMN
jgi:gas vesicle protein